MPGHVQKITIRAPAGNTLIDAWIYDGDESFDFEIVGESRKQDQLHEIVEGEQPGRSGYDVQKLAMIVPEPDNPYDPNAMLVVVQPHAVGYIPKDTAAKVKSQLVKLNAKLIVCNAKVVGGFKMRDGSTAHLGVKLDFGLPLK